MSMRQIIYECAKNPEKVLILDTETTGLERDRQVIELGIVDYNGNTVLNQRFKVDIPIAEGASQVHGIYERDLVSCPTPEEYIEKLSDLFTDKIIVTYNAFFDYVSIRNTFGNIFNNTQVIECLMIASTEFLAQKKYRKLENICKEFGVTIADLGDHNAIDDALKVQRLLRVIVSQNPHLTSEPKTNTPAQTIKGLIQSVFLKLPSETLLTLHPVLYRDDYGSFLTLRTGGIVRVYGYDYDKHEILYQEENGKIQNIHLPEKSNRQIAITFIHCHEKPYFRELFLLDDDKTIPEKLADRAGEIFHITMYDEPNDSHISRYACYIYGKRLTKFKKQYERVYSLDFSALDKLLMEYNAYGIISHPVFQQYLDDNMQPFVAYEYLKNPQQYEYLYEVDNNLFCSMLRKARENYRRNFFYGAEGLVNANRDLIIDVLSALLHIHTRKYGNTEIDKIGLTTPFGKYEKKSELKPIEGEKSDFGEIQTGIAVLTNSQL